MIGVSQIGIRGAWEFAYSIKLTENGQTLPKAREKEKDKNGRYMNPASNDYFTTGGANGWNVYVTSTNPVDKIPEGKPFKTKVSFHAKYTNNEEVEEFSFSPRFPSDAGIREGPGRSHPLSKDAVFWFAPTATSGGRRRGSKRRNRKGSRRR